MKIIARLNELKKGKTVEEFSRQCGVKPTTMVGYLEGWGVPAHVVYRICFSCGCSADWLLGLVDGGTRRGNAQIMLNAVVTQVRAQIEEMKNFLRDMEV